MKIYEQEENERNKIKQKKQIEDWIDPSIRFEFGKGEIRYKENGKYLDGKM